LEPRAPAEPRRREQREVANPEPTGRERAMQPLVTEGHHGVGAELRDIDRNLSQRLGGVDDRDRSGVASEAACFAHRRHVPGLARDERAEERAAARTGATTDRFEALLGAP